MFEEYYKNGAVKTSITYRRGKLHGPSRLYTPGNHLISYTEYVNGKREGPAFSYYDNEQPKVLAYRKMTNWTARPKNLTAGANWCAWLPIGTARKLRA